MENFFDKEKEVNATVDSVAMAIRSFRKQPFKHLYIKLLTILLIFFNCLTLQLFIKGLNEIGFDIPTKIQHLNPAYTIIWAICIGCLFVAAVYQTVSQLEAKVNNSISSNSPIKGLIAFNSNDVEVFKNLERNFEIQIYRAALLSSNFRIGILIGESGCGKTSFLNAGLAPELNNIKKVKCIVITFSNTDPVQSIVEALRGQLENEKIENGLLLKDILASLSIIKQHEVLILIFDQFEQFFSQNPIAEKRTNFIQQIKNVYQDLKEVKILLGIRSDFSGYLHEVQSALNYTLNAVSNYFELKRFRTFQVVNIIKYIASTENLSEDDVDEKFVEQLVNNELAGEDSLISAADLQILLWIMKTQKIGNAISFREKEFKALGGVKGLLQTYIEEQLALPNFFNNSDDILKCLLAFIDLNTNLRIGQINLPQLRKRLPSSFNFQNLTEILIWLENLRLINKINVEKSESRYELTHERLIEPIQNIENNNDGDSRKASKLLEKRTNEWLNNSRQSRYLLTISDLRFIYLNKKLLTWGHNRDLKSDFYLQSLKHFKIKALIVLGALMTFFLYSLFVSTNYYKYEIKSVSNIKQLLLENKNKITPDLNVLDSLISLDPTIVGDFCSTVYRDDIKLDFINMRLRRDTNDNTIHDIFNFIDSITDSNYKVSAQIALGNSIRKLDILKSDSLFIEASKIYISSRPSVKFGSEYETRLVLRTDLIQTLVYQQSDKALKIITDYYLTQDSLQQLNFFLTVYNFSKSSNLTNGKDYLNYVEKNFSPEFFKTLNEEKQLLLVAQDLCELHDEKGRQYYKQAVSLLSNSDELDDRDDMDKDEDVTDLGESLINQNDSLFALEAFELITNLKTQEDKNDYFKDLIDAISKKKLTQASFLYKKLFPYIAKSSQIEKISCYVKILENYPLNQHPINQLAWAKINELLPTLNEKSKKIAKFKIDEFELLSKVDTNDYAKKINDQFLKYTNREDFYIGNSKVKDSYENYKFIVNDLILKSDTVQKKAFSKVLAIVSSNKDLQNYYYLVAAFSSKVEKLKIPSLQVDTVLRQLYLNKDYSQFLVTIYDIRNKFPALVKLYQKEIETIWQNEKSDLRNNFSTNTQVNVGFISNIFSSLGYYNLAYSIWYKLLQSSSDPNRFLNMKANSLLLVEIENVITYRRQKNDWLRLFWK